MSLPAAALKVSFGKGPLVAHDQLGLALVLVGFIGSFAFIRMSTRLMRSPRVSWWPGSIVRGGVHVHHLAFGIILMLAAGTLGFAFYTESPWLEICAGLFGIGAGLTIDEFALWVYLDDVYWTEEGRSSIDATVIAAAAMGLVLLGARPFEFPSGSPAKVIESIVVVALLLGLVTTCFFKRRILHGAIGFFFGPIAIYGALRLGKPDSPWGRRFYGTRDPEKQARAEERFRPERRTERFKQRFRDIVGGSTEAVYEQKLAERAAARETADAMRQRADEAAYHSAGEQPRS